VWTTVAELVRDTLAPAAEIDESDAHETVMAVLDVGRVLVSAGHLDHEALTLIAGPLRLEITVVSGTDATTLSENLNTVPGAASASDWTLYFPTPESVGEWVADAVAVSPRLKAEGPPALKESAQAAVSGSSDIDAAALARLLGEDQP
jgi:hypothetical protein